MRDEIDIEEISNHIKNLRTVNKEECKVDDEKELMVWEEVSSQDIFEVVKSEEDKTIMDLNINKRKCDICKETIDLEENLSGLVLHDTHFLCEECCQDSSKAELDIWMNTKMAKPGDLKPVALWLMKEKNKTRLF